MNYGNLFLINLRYLLSFLGILKIIKIIIGIFNKEKEYEKKYSEAMLKSVENNFCIWDVGANKGIYIKKFLKINKANSVIAFEPTPYLCKFIKSKFSVPIKNRKLFVYNFALSDKSKKSFFWVSKKNSVENSLIYHSDKPTISSSFITFKISKIINFFNL